MKISLKIYLRDIICFLLTSLSATYLKVDSGYRLGLSFDLNSNPLLLKLFRSTIPVFISQGIYETLYVVKKELLNGMRGLIGKGLQVDKSVNYNEYIC